MKNKIIRNTIFSGLSSLTVGVIGFLLLPFMIHKVGVVEYGLVGISYIFAMSGYVSLLEMGFQSSISKYVAEFYAKGEKLKICQIVITACAMFLCMGIVLMIAGVALSGIFARHLFIIPAEYQSSFQRVLILIFISYVFQFPTIVYAGLLEGVQRFDILKGIQTLTAIIIAGGIILFLALGYNYVAIVVCTLLGLFVQFCVYTYSAFKVLPFLSIKYEYLSYEIIKKIWIMTKFLFIGRVSSLIYHNTPKLLTGMLLGPVFVTSYEVVVRLPRFIKTSLGFLNSAVMPAASELDANGQENKLKKLFERGFRYQIIIAFPIIIGAMYFAEEFLRVWMGSGFTYLYRLLQFVLICELVLPFINYGGSIFVGMNRKLKQLTIIHVVMTVMSIVIALVLISEYKLNGVIAAYACSPLILFPIYLSIYLKEFNVNFAFFIKDVSFVLFIALIPASLALLINQVELKECLAILFLKGLIWCIAYWVALYAFVLRDEDKTIIKDFLPMYTKC